MVRGRQTDGQAGGSGIRLQIVTRATPGLGLTGRWNGAFLLSSSAVRGGR